jgi:hypothetical protein
MSVSVRSQRVIAHYGLVLGIILIIIGVVALGGAWFVFSNPPVNQVSEQTDQQRIQTSSETRAVVTGTNQTLYEQGRVLVDKSAYLFKVSPVMTLEITTSVPEGQPVTVQHRLSTTFTASRDEELFWSETRLLKHDDTQVRDGQASMEVSLNVTEMRNLISDRQSAVGGVGSFSHALNLTVDYDTGQYSGQISDRTLFTFAGGGYWLDGGLSGSASHSETVTRQETGSPNMSQVFILGGLGGLFLLLGIALAILYFRTPDVERLETMIARSRYDEWISNGQIPTKSEREYIRIETLEDLVDIAIDQNKRVLYDANYDAYAVIESDHVYYFATGERAFDDWLEV